jgi:hypothetical protein
MPRLKINLRKDRLKNKQALSYEGACIFSNELKAYRNYRILFSYIENKKRL